MTRQSIISVLVVACWIKEACSSLPSSASSTSSSSWGARACTNSDYVVCRNDAVNGSSAWQWQRCYSYSQNRQTGYSCFLFHSSAKKCVRLQQKNTSARKIIEPLGGGIALRASRSTKPKDDSGAASKKGTSSISSKGRRMKKSDIDNLVRGMYGQ
jgi:hypothetical protein